MDLVREPSHSMIVLHHDTLETALKDMSRAPAKFIVAHAKNTLKPAHALTEIGFGGFHRQVEVIPHNDPRMQNPTRAFTRFPQCLFESVFGALGFKNPTAPITAFDHMIKPALGFESELSCNGPIGSWLGINIKR